VVQITNYTSHNEQTEKTGIKEDWAGWGLLDGRVSRFTWSHERKISTLGKVGQE
jgi:hypothetical protein